MSNKRKRKAFWRRRKPRREHDITLLKPRTLKKGKRFETWCDARQESERSQALLREGEAAALLAGCRNGERCERPFCPICARQFRRWFIGELIRVAESQTEPIYVLTVLLKTADRSAISELEFRRPSHMLRKRLQRAGLEHASVIGGVENAYRARDRKWVLHVNLLVFRGDERAIARFSDTFKRDDIERPVVTVPLIDLPKQLSYLLKFVTYHRPYAQRGPTKGRAVPLNGPDHRALVQWMHERQFVDFLFLFNARREGGVIHVSKR